MQKWGIKLDYDAEDVIVDLRVTNIKPPYLSGVFFSARTDARDSVVTALGDTLPA